MTTISPYQNDLIIRYLCGEAGEDEIMQLSQWLNENEENQKIFEEYRKTWSEVDRKSIDRIDVSAEWERLEGQISEPVANRFRTPGRILRMAAIFLLLAIPAYFLLRYYTKPDQHIYTATQEILEKDLPDGTSVILNSGSTLKFGSFEGPQRDVALNGEAYFQVAHDQNKPFIISSENVRIAVLGTSFYVNTNGKNGKQEVVLDKGRVALYYIEHPGEQIILNPGEKAEIHSGVITKSVNADQNYMSWKTHRFVFENRALPEIIAAINKVYHTNIVLASPDLASCLVTATFDQQTPEAILNVLKATLDLTIQQSGNNIQISGNGCKQ